MPQDDGCSCPVPFERIASLDELTPLTKVNYESVESELKRYFDATEMQELRGLLR